MTTQEYVVYNTHSGNVITHPAPREMAARICNTFNDAYNSSRYAIRPVLDFDYDELIENAWRDDLWLALRKLWKIHMNANGQ